MRNLRASSVVIGVAAALMTGAAACGDDGVGASGDPKVVFGGVMELSGSQQIYGRPSKFGLDAAVRAINADGGITAGGRTYEASIEIVDDRSDPSAVAGAARKVARARPVAAIGSLNEQVSYEVWRPAGIIMFAASFQLQEPLRENPEQHPLLFSPTPFYAPAYAASMRRVAALFPAIERVAILSPQTEEGEGAQATYEASARAAGLRVVHSELFPYETTDFSALLTAIKAKAPDLLIALQSSEQAVTIMQQAAQLGVAQHALNDAMTPADALDAQGLAGLRVIIPGIAPTYSDEATLPDYDPEAIFGDADTPAVPVAAIVSYYAYRLLAQAIEQAGTVDDPAAIAEALVGQSHDGPFGTCSVTEQRDLHCEALVEVVRDGAVDVYRYPGPDANEPSAEYVCRGGSCTRR